MWWTLLAPVLAGAGDVNHAVSRLTELRPFDGATGVPIDANPLLVVENTADEEARVRIVLYLASTQAVVALEDLDAWGHSGITPWELTDERMPDTEYRVLAEQENGLEDSLYQAFTTGSERVAPLRPPEIVVGGYASANEQADGSWIHQASWVVDAEETADGLSWARILRSDDGSEVVRFLPERSEDQDGTFVGVSWTGELETALCVVAVSVDAAGNETEASAEHCVDIEQFALSATSSCGCSRVDTSTAALVLLPLWGWRRRTRPTSWG